MTDRYRMPEPDSDRDLIAAEAGTGLREAFVTEHLRRVFLQIYRMVGSVHDAQDLTQEAFIKALQRQDQLKNEQKAAHWLSRIATNTALDFLRRGRRIAFVELGEAPERHTESAFFGASGFGSSGFESAEDALLRGETRDWLAEGLERLTPRERAALVLRDVEDLPAEEVARRLGCSRATVRSHIANARIKLKKYAESKKGSRR